MVLFTRRATLVGWPLSSVLTRSHEHTKRERQQREESVWASLGGAKQTLLRRLSSSFPTILQHTERVERPTEMGLELEAVGDLALHVILTKLGPKDTATAACVSKKLRSSASEESLWSKFCSQDLDLKHPLDPLGNPTPSFKVHIRKSYFIFSFMINGVNVQKKKSNSLSNFSSRKKM